MLERLKTVHGAGSGLDADTVDGKHAFEFEPVFVKNTAFNKNFGNGAGTVTEGNDPRLSDTRDPKAHGHDASDITSGVIDIARMPAAALERLVIVANQTERYALTTAQVQTGDTVKQDDTGIMYRVVDDTKLNQAAGYVEYSAARAAAVDWSGVENKPATYPPSAHGHAISDVVNLQSALDGKEPVFVKNTAFNKNFGTAAGTVTEGNDPRLSDARTPVSHALGGSEHSASTLAQLNAKISNATLIDTGDSRLSDDRTPLVHGNDKHSINYEPEFSKNTAFNKDFGTGAGTVAEGSDARLSDARTPIVHALGGNEHGESTLAQLNAKISDATLIDTNDARLSDARTPLNHGNEKHSTNFEPEFSKNSAFNKNFGTAVSTVCEGDDARLSNARTPTTHALAGNEHSTSTLAQLNGKISDATLIDTGDSRLSDSREWTAATVSQEEAEAGTAATRRAWTAQRVAQAIAALGGGGQNPEFTTVKVNQQAYFGGQVDNGDSGASKTINWQSGNKQRITLTGNCTLSFTAPSGPTSLTLLVQQDSNGNRTLTFPSSCKWPAGVAPTVHGFGANSVHVFTFYYDGTNYYGAWGNKFE